MHSAQNILVELIDLALIDLLQFNLVMENLNVKRL